MDDILMYIPNNDAQSCRLKLVVETFECTQLNLSKFTKVKSPQSCKANV